MTVKEFYDTIGADYQNVLSRLMKDALVLKFLNKYKEINGCEIEITVHSPAAGSTGRCLKNSRG